MVPFKTILFATDFSEASKMAFGVASALARDYKARMIVVHVIEPAHMGFSEFAAYVGPEEDKGQAMALLQAIKPPSPMVTIEYRLLEGDPATVLVETAQETEADLMVMGTHGRSGLTRLVMGSVAEDVLRRAPCPVMTVREPIAEKIPAAAETTEAVSI
jgi:nucleotide-binding universal stress UspA family protein